ncbi:MAG: AMP-dependent synthetase/ligase [Acidobacteriota bacterium]
MSAAPPPDSANLSQLFFARAAAHPERTALRYRQGGGLARLTYGEMAERVRDFSAGLALLGLRKGDCVALVSENSPRWLMADMAVLACGAVDVPRSTQLTDRELSATLRHAGCRYVLAAGAPEVERLRRLGESLPDLERIIDLSNGSRLPGRTMGFADVCDTGRRKLQTGGSRPAQEAAGPGDLATIVYTSGTTGRPKGVMLTHGNILSNVAAIRQVMHVRPEDRVLSILPSWHMYERIVEYATLFSGAVLTYTTLRALREDLRTVRPTFFASVPRIWSKLHQAACARMAEAPLPLRLLARTSISLGFRALLARKVLAGEPDPGLGPRRPGRFRAALEWLACLPVLKLLCRGVVLRGVRHATGGCLRGALSGGASLPMTLDLFFEAAGVKLLNGYGLTETSPVLTCRRLSHNILGTVGRPLPGTRVRFLDDGGAPQPAGGTGRIVVKGPQVMAGYYRDEEATRAVLDAEGWFETGDLGKQLPSGDVVITGRLKDTIVLANGENVEPESIEAWIRTSAFVDQVVVVGQDQEYLAALVVPAFDELEAWARRRRIAFQSAGTLVRHAEVQALFREQLARRAGSGCRGPRAEVVKRFHLLDRAFSVEDGTLTPTLKIRRAVVADRYRDEIQSLFRRAGGAGKHST